MKAAVKVGSLVAERGTFVKGYLEVTRRLDGLPVSVPVMIVNGQEDGPVLALTAAVHGNEPQGVMAIVSEIPRLRPHEICGAIIAVPVVHMDAFDAKRRENQADCVDLNRVAPGNTRGRLAHKIAHTLFTEVVRRATYFLDLHSSGDRINVLPMAVCEAGFEDTSISFAKSLGLDIIWQGQHAVGTWRSEALKAGVIAASVEITDVAWQRKAILNALRAASMLPGKPELPASWRVVQGHPRYSVAGGLRFPQVAIRDDVQQGQVIGRLLSVFGEETEVITAEYDGVVCSLRHYPATNPGNEVVGYYKVIQTLT
jgi:predicted deacylase